MKTLFLYSCYMACVTTGPHNHLSWNRDLYVMMTEEAVALRNRGFSVIAMGDFNAKIGRVEGLEDNRPDLNSNTPLFLSFIKTLNLTILNTLPISKGVFTHFVEHTGVPYSESLLDYGLADTSLAPFVSSFVIDANARVECGTDHALLVETIKCDGLKAKISSKFSDILNFKLPINHDYTEFDSIFETQTTFLSSYI